jgi:glycosyltransferase involved in cell wall biosynthesis
MRILLCVYSCNPYQGREQGRGWNCAWHLAQLGHEVWALTKASNQSVIERSLAEHSLPNLHFIYIDDHPWIQQLKASQLGKMKTRSLQRSLEQLGYLLWQRQAYQTALQLTQTHEFDVVHHLTMSVLTGGSLLWKLNKPFVFGPAGGGQTAPAAFKRYFLNQWKSEARRSFVIEKVLPLNPILRRTVSHTDLNLVTNRETADLAFKLGAKRVEFLLQTGLPDRYFPPGFPRRQPSPELRLLWVGVIEPRKALPLALEALAKVDPAIPFKLTILGSGSVQSQIPGLAAQLNLTDKLDCRGYVSWEAVRQECLNSDVMLFTSLRDTCPAQVIEAMAVGLPIVTVDHQGVHDLVPQDAGIKIAVTQPEETSTAMAKAIEWMYHHPAERVEMGRAAYEFAKTQVWEKKARKLVEYYGEVLRQAKPVAAQSAQP